jgi:hypothetical protein
MIARQRNEYPRKVWDMNDVAGLIAARKAAIAKRWPYMKAT